MSRTTSELISQIKLFGSFPSSDSLFSNANYLAFLNTEMQKEIVPLLRTINEEHFLTVKEIPIEAGKNKYRIPSRAIGASLRDIQILNSDNSITQLNRLYEEDRTSLDKNELGYFLVGNQIEISPMPNITQGSLRLLYFRRPSAFVLPSECSQINSIDTLNNQITVNSIPSTMTSGILVDFLQASSPFDLLAMDSEIIGISGTTITFSSLPDDLAINDYIALAGQTCVPMIPDEFITILIQAALCSALSSKKDKAVELELQKLKVLKDTILPVMIPRVTSSDKKIVVKNGLLR